MKIFVYGTLKRDRSAYQKMINCGASFVKSAKTGNHYHIRNLGGFPGMVRDTNVNHPVNGEVFEVEEKNLGPIDAYEGVDHENPSYGLFRREEIELEDGEKVHAYLINRKAGNRPIIEDGVWENASKYNDY